MTTVTLEEAQANLPTILEHLLPGEEITIINQGQPVAQMKKAASAAIKTSRPGPGLCKGMITYRAPDFDAPLEDMREYME